MKSLIWRLTKKRKDEIDRLKALKARLEGEKASNDKTIVSCTENVSTVKLESHKITENVLKLTETVERYQEDRTNIGRTADICRSENQYSGLRRVERSI